MQIHDDWTTPAFEAAPVAPRTGERVEHIGDPRVLGVLVAHGEAFGGDARVPEQDAGPSRVLTADERDAGEHLRRAR